MSGYFTLSTNCETPCINLDIYCIRIRNITIGGIFFRAMGTLAGSQKLANTSNTKINHSFTITEPDRLGEHSFMHGHQRPLKMHIF